jgi:hypothetical protein
LKRSSITTHAWSITAIYGIADAAIVAGPSGVVMLEREEDEETG